MERTETSPQHNRFSLAFGFFAGPAAWYLLLLIGYALVPAACRSGSKLSLYLASGAAAIIILIAGLLSYRLWRSAAGQPGPADEAANPRWPEFAAASGLLLSSLFFLLVVYTGISQIFLIACPVNTIPLP